MSVCRVLEFVDEDEAIGQLQGAPDMRARAQQQFSEPVKADEGPGRPRLGSELARPPSVDRELRAGPRSRSSYRRAGPTRMVGPEIVLRQAQKLGLPIVR